MIDIAQDCDNIKVKFAEETEVIKLSINDCDCDPIVVNLGEYSGQIDDYNLLRNKPSIDGVTIEGDLTSTDLGLVKSYDELQDRPSIDGVTLEGDMTSEDLGLVKSYDELEDKPSIDGVTLSGAMTSEDLGLVKSYDDLQDRPSIDGVTLEGDLTSSDLGLVKSYDELEDKPSIDGVTIEGDKTYSDYGIVKKYEEIQNKPTLNGNEIEESNTSESLGIVLFDTYEGWSAKGNSISQSGVVYVYTNYHTIDDSGSRLVYPGVKIGDGTTKINSLSFINPVDPRILRHISNSVIHITSSERNTWNAAVSEINAIRRKLSGSMHNIGVTTTAITDGSTIKPIIINGSSVYPAPGDVVRKDDKEFMYSENGMWIELGSAGAKVLRGTTAYWNSQASLISEKDVSYIYTDYRVITHGDGTTTTYYGLKIGDGRAYLIDIPFIGGGGGGSDSGITQDDIDNWNNKWSGYINPNNPENLVFYT